MIEGFTKTSHPLQRRGSRGASRWAGPAAALDPRVSAKSYVLGKRGAAIGAAA